MQKDAYYWTRVTFICERLHCLPNAGGLFQQDENHINKMEKVLMAADKYNDKKSQQAESKERVDKIAEDESI